MAKKEIIWEGKKHQIGKQDDLWMEKYKVNLQSGPISRYQSQLREHPILSAIFAYSKSTHFGPNIKSRKKV